MKISAHSLWIGTDARAALVRGIGTAPRRAGQFAELALLGAAQCAAGNELPADTAIVLSSGYGNRKIAEELVHTVAVERTAPMPFAFIASQSGGACQVVARHLGVNGPALCISSSRAPFERALLLTAAMLSQGDVDTALVGWIEESNAEQRQSISQWLYIDARSRAVGADIVALTEVDVDQARTLTTMNPSILDIDEAASIVSAEHPPCAELAMACRLESWWREGGTYVRVRAADNGRFVALHLQNPPHS